MLSSFFWGYLCTQIIAGQLAERYGPKWFLAGTYFIGSLFSILIPSFGALFGYQGVIACRVIQGLSQGFLFPCLHNMLGKWCPVGDRAKACGFSYAGWYGILEAIKIFSKTQMSNEESMMCILYRAIHFKFIYHLYFFSKVIIFIRIAKCTL